MDSIARDNQRWIGIHRWTRGLHKAPTRHRVLAAAGPLIAGLVTVGSIWLLLSGFGRPHGRIPPQVLPGIVGTALPSPGPAGSPSSYPARSSTQSTADRAPGTTPSPANEGGTTPEMADAPVPALSPTPTPAATTAAADAPPPLPPPLPPVLTSTPPVCPPLPTPGKSKKAKPSHPSHW